MPDRTARLFLAGDVMLGRGVDQILPHPGDPRLRESYVTDARTYVQLAEEAHGRLTTPVEAAWPWGDALATLDHEAPDVRVLNLETSITRSDDFVPGKGVHYRMHPDNLAGLLAARPDVCVLANNHVLDFGIRGLEETLDVLSAAGVRTAGAGRDHDEARQPAVIPLGDDRRLLVFALGATSSGIPAGWAASPDRPGIEVVDEPLADHTSEILDRIERWRRPADRVVVSIHWGSNWGYRVPRNQTRVAHALIEGGVDVVHGHSSHHPRPLEVHRDRLILYGCGDLINDYEGIGGHEGYRADLRLLYLVDVEVETGELVGLRMLPMRARRLRLERAGPDDGEWLRSSLDEVSRDRGVRVVGGPHGDLVLERA